MFHGRPASRDELLELRRLLALSFLYWNTQGKLTQTDTLESQAPIQAFPDRPNLGETGSQRRNWHYDASGLLKAESCPEKTGPTEYLTYDALGNPREKTEGGSGANTATIRPDA